MIRLYYSELAYENEQKYESFLTKQILPELISLLNEISTHIVLQKI
jgi:hypothetical protein